MVQYQGVSTCILRGAGRINRTGVIVLDVEQHLVEMRQPAFLERCAQDLDHLNVQCIVQQQVCAFCHPHKFRVIDGIARDGNRAVLVVDAKAKGRVRRVMGDRYSGDGQIRGFMDDDRLVAHRKCTRSGAKARKVGNVRTVMGQPIGAVDPVGGVEAVHDFANALRSPNRGRGLAAAVDPALQQELTQPVDMIGMQMCQKSCLDPSHGKAHPPQISDAARAGVYDKNMAPGDDPGAGACTQRVGHRRACTADKDMQPVGQGRRAINTRVLVGNTRHHRLGDVYLPGFQPDDGKDNDGHYAEQDLQFSGHASDLSWFSQ